MKKVIIAAVFGAICAFLFAFTQCKTVAHADAGDNIIGVSTAELSADDITSDVYYTGGLNSVSGLSNIQAGDFIVILTVENGTGFAGSGIQIAYDKTNFEPYHTNLYTPFVQCEGLTGLAVSALVYDNNGYFGLTTSGSVNTSSSEETVTLGYFFLKRRPNAPNTTILPLVSTKVIQFATAKSVDLDYEETTLTNPPAGTTTVY